MKTPHEMKPALLVETALLTQGLESLPNQALLDALPNLPIYTWVENGELVVGDLGRYLPFRSKGKTMPRLNSESMEKAMAEGVSGPLSASGAMAACHQLGIRLAVSCGIGGITRPGIPGPTVGADLLALAKLPVCLVATGPKDMMNLAATFAWLAQHGVTVLGKQTAPYEGFLFARPPVALQGVYDGVSPLPGLLLNPLPRRFEDDGILKRAVAAGLAAHQQDKHFHPAVNAAIDNWSKGESARRQLAAIKRNVEWGHELTLIAAC